ncbi:MAG TPA: DUF3450 family protein [Candidatus Polarisedimenticolaceae bacterium]|nr:DUF3450 family protein [Candidatus Polarisedimenticolaceae bacterium]
MRRRLTHRLAGLAVVAATTGVLGQNAGGEDGSLVRSTRGTLAKWVETQQILSKEKQDWQLAKQVLEQRIALMQSEIDTLEQRIAETAVSIGDADRKRQERIAENERLKQASTALARTIATLESKTRTLLATLPAPLAERIGPLAQRIPVDPQRTELSLTERFQNVIGILDQANKFNGDVTVVTETREVADGVTAEVQTIYLGLGQAYYVTANGESAGVGVPSVEGWNWTRADELAPRVLEVIGIVKNEQVPAYVPLPVRVQ